MLPLTAHSLIVIGHQKLNRQKIAVFFSLFFFFFYFWIFIVSSYLLYRKCRFFITLFHSISHYSNLAMMWKFPLRLYYCTFAINWFSIFFSHQILNPARESILQFELSLFSSWWIYSWYLIPLASWLCVSFIWLFLQWIWLLFVYLVNNECKCFLFFCCLLYCRIHFCN